MEQTVQKLNIRQIAKFAGVSPATVSRVLNSQGGSKTDTHKRVREVLRSNGYERKKRVPPKATFLCINEYDDDHVTPHALKILAHLDEIASTRQCELLTIHTTDPKRITEKTGDSRISGVIYLGDILPSTIDKPSVILNRNSIHENYSSVDCDDILGLTILLRHLKDIGHERIAYFSDALFQKNNLHSPRKSFEVLKAFALAGIKKPIIWDFDLNPGNEYATFEKIAEKFLALDLNERPTALALCGDTYASFAYKAFGKQGIRIPEDCSFTGFDDEPFCTHLSPTLTTLRKPLESMCETAMELLFDAIKNNENTIKRILVKPELVLRESVKTVIS